MGMTSGWRPREQTSNKCTTFEWSEGPRKRDLRTRCCREKWLPSYQGKSCAVSQKCQTLFSVIVLYLRQREAKSADKHQGEHEVTTYSLFPLRTRDTHGLGGAGHINLEGSRADHRIGREREGTRDTKSMVLGPGGHHRLDRAVCGGRGGLSRMRIRTGTSDAEGVILLRLLVVNFLLLLSLYIR